MYRSLAMYGNRLTTPPIYPSWEKSISIFTVTAKKTWNSELEQKPIQKAACLLASFTFFCQYSMFYIFHILLYVEWSLDENKWQLLLFFLLEKNPISIFMFHILLYLGWSLNENKWQLLLFSLLEKNPCPYLCSIYYFMKGEV